MKTYTIVALLLMGFSFVSCEKSNEEPTEELPVSYDADYTILLTGTNSLYAQLLGSTANGLTKKNEPSTFVTSAPQFLSFRTKEEISIYSSINCDATVQLYNSKTDQTNVLEVFEDLAACAIEVTAIAHTNNYIVLSYVRELEGKEKQFMLRFIDLAGDSSTFIDVSLEKKPVDLMPSMNKLFVLTLNEFVTNEFHLSVIDLDTKENLMELDLGYDATKLFKSNSGAIIISYPELHTVLNASTLDKEYTLYGSDTVPGFITTKDSFMDSYGRLYFQKSIPSAAIETVPAIYDFDKNNTVVYLYENFMTEAELNIKYDIATTTSIGYDEENDLILIGYQKKGQQGGGILRISPTPNFKIIDDIDLDAVPESIFVN